MAIKMFDKKIRQLRLILILDSYHLIKKQHNKVKPPSTNKNSPIEFMKV